MRLAARLRHRLVQACALPARKIGLEVFLRYRSEASSLAHCEAPPGVFLHRAATVDEVEALLPRLQRLAPSSRRSSKHIDVLLYATDANNELLAFWCFQKLGRGLVDRGLFVHRPMRRRGIAGALLADAARTLEPDGIVYVAASIDNEAVRHVFARAGLRFYEVALLLESRGTGRLELRWTPPSVLVR